jgi:hypothetical protein
VLFYHSTGTGNGGKPAPVREKLCRHDQNQCETHHYKNTNANTTIKPAILLKSFISISSFLVL